MGGKVSGLAIVKLGSLAPYLFLWKMASGALAGVAQLVGYHPTNQKVTGSIPGQGKCLGCGFGPQSGRVREATDRCFSLTSMFVSLSFSLPSPVSGRRRILKKKERKRENMVCGGHRLRNP